MLFSREDIERSKQLIALKQTIDARRLTHPFEFYEPSYPGLVRKDGKVCGPYANQLAYHRSRHKVRLLVPGNGWGKTTAMGAEAHAWATHSNRWQETPRHPVLMVWFCNLKEQFEMIRVQLQEEVFGDEARWVDDQFKWPDGSVLAIGLASRAKDWRKWQGIPVDQIFFDEEPPPGLWREMGMRSRGKRKTRYTFGATATGGEGSFMETELYKPWLEFHRARGLDEDAAMAAQLHPQYFVWPKGGLRDNPAADAEDEEWYEGRTWRSEAEKRVRLHGGFARFTGDPVFDIPSLERMLANAVEGRLVGLVAA